jgi:hypothetical protein
VSADPASENDVARLIDAAAGAGVQPGELWRYTSPHRGLSAMEEKRPTISSAEGGRLWR